MDIAIKKRTWTPKRLLIAGGMLVIAVLIVSSFFLVSGKSRMNVNADRLTLSNIQKGTFSEFIPVTGVVMPITTIYLDAAEGGRLEEKYVDDGAFIKKGEPILRLSNTDLELSLVNQETSVFNLLTQMQISRNATRQNTIAKLNQMADVENAFKEAERLYTLNKQLFEQKVISGQEFKQSQISYDYQVKKKKLTEQILQQDSSSAKQELEQTRQSYDRTSNALAVMRKKVGDLIVRAPVDGQLTSLDAEIGQNKNKGERLGQIDVLSGFKVRADIDEHYISRIFTGLKGTFNINGKDYALKITKVYTQVTNGHFQVDMAFADNVPEAIRRGQTLQVRLTLSDASQALLLPRGGFYQQTGGNWIFKISEDGTTAYKTDIQIGRQNPDFYEVMSGLNPGDKVITSSYENFGNNQELLLKK